MLAPECLGTVFFKVVHLILDYRRLHFLLTSKELQLFLIGFMKEHELAHLLLDSILLALLYVVIVLRRLAQVLEVVAEHFQPDRYRYVGVLGEKLLVDSVSGLQIVDKLSQVFLW